MENLTDDEESIITSLLKKYSPLVGTMPFKQLVNKAKDDVMTCAIYDSFYNIAQMARLIKTNRSSMTTIVHRLQREGKIMNEDYNPYELLIKEAKRWIGTVEVGNNNGATINMFQDYISPSLRGQSYCCCFALYCVGQADAELKAKRAIYIESKLKKTGSVMDLWNSTPKAKKSNIPFVGALVVWQKLDAKGKETIYGHIGVVQEIEGEDCFYSIEANTSPGEGVERNGQGIYLKKHSMHPTGFKLKGFIAAW